MTSPDDSLLRNDLRDVLTSRTRASSAGYPYLHRAVWARLRDWVPFILADAQRVLDVVHELAIELGQPAESNVRVVRQVIRTAAITAPPDLWLMRHVQSALTRAGLSQRFLAGEVLTPSTTGFLREEIEIDFRFLLSRGTLARQGAGYRLVDHLAAREFMALPPTPTSAHASQLWLGALNGDVDADLPAQDWSGTDVRERGMWHPSARQVEVGAQLVPLVVALKAKGCIEPILQRGEFEDVFPDAAIDELARKVLVEAGVLTARTRLTDIGGRVLGRGPGPFGIIEAYRGYLAELEQIWAKGRGAVWVERSANVAASQAANRKSFARAHNALDAFCRDTGFTYSVFIEHAVGKGEAIRQRAERTKGLTFVGADLEDAAIDAAEQERALGHLPAATRFVRRADIGAPDTLLHGLRALNVEADGAVMMVGNGFHEVRGKDDETMTEVFHGYERAGLVLIFTEETALSVDDLLETAFNTYHAGFRYVHERSGQSLRPATDSPPSPLEGKRPMSWAECAERAGYVRADGYCQKSRTVYPYTPPSGFNPSISVDHFFIPSRIGAKWIR